jgi:transcriptional regulator with XRE-family HTH domain
VQNRGILAVSEHDYEQIARELMRALRGKRSQPAMSRRLGFRTNVAYAWEAGRSYPTASGFLRAAQRCGIDVRRALESFYRAPPPWLSEGRSATNPRAVARLLSDLGAGRPVVVLAAAVGKSRFTVARFMRGDTEPRLPDFLRIVQGTTLRLLDFLSVFVDPARIPSVTEAARRLETSRRIAYEEPLTHAVLRVLELADYRALPAHTDGFIAGRLAITPAAERRYLALLQQSGQIELRGGRFVPTEVSAVDTRRDATKAAALRRFWTQVALERAGHRDDDVFAFNLGTIALHDLPRIQDLHRRYFAELRAIVAASEPAEALLLANVQLVRMA